MESCVIRIPYTKWQNGTFIVSLHLFLCFWLSAPLLRKQSVFTSGNFAWTYVARMPIKSIFYDNHFTRKAEVDFLSEALFSCSPLSEHFTLRIEKDLFFWVIFFFKLGKKKCPFINLAGM